MTIPSPTPGVLGWVLAIAALILCVVLYAVGRIPALEAILIGLAAAARLC